MEQRRSILIPWERRGWWREIRLGRWIRRVLVVVLLVWAIVEIWRHTDTTERTRVTRASIARIRRAVLTFKADFGRCPHGIGELAAPRDRDPYLREIPMDGWGRSFDFTCPGRKEPDTADIRSRGPDGSWFGGDEIE